MLRTALGILGISLVVTATAHAAAVEMSVDAALTANMAAATYAEWQESNATPTTVFKAIDALNDPSAWQALCSKLDTLTAEDLALFENELSKVEHAAKLPCRAKLLAKLRKFWNESETKMDLHHHPETFAAAIAPAPAPKLPTLVSEVRVVDAASAPVFERGPLQKGEIAFTFDDGPHPTLTNRVLAILKEAGIRATFFEVGQNAQRMPTLSREVYNQGHTVGSHSWDHANMPRLAPSAAEANILKGHQAVMDAVGVETPFFRFPYGAHTKTLSSWVQSNGWATFYWNMDSLDWKIRNPVALFQNVLKELDREKGGIILFHDIHEQTVIVLPHVIEEVAKRGWKTIVFVPQNTPPKP